MREICGLMRNDQPNLVSPSLCLHWPRPNICSCVRATKSTERVADSQLVRVLTAVLIQLNL